jgi:hypothetical protein
MAEKQTGDGDSSNPERDEALRRARHLPLPAPMSDEEFKQAREDARRREERDALLPVYDPVAAEHMAYEMNPLTRADERFRVQDSVEAEHMAHAMDPHYERASEIDGVKERTDEAIGHALHSDDTEEVFAPEDAPPEVRRSAVDLFEDRIDSLDNESTTLGDAASSARKAGDAHGEQVSKAYRRKKESGDA